MKWLLTAAAVLSAAAVACAEPPAVESDPAAYVLWVAQNIFTFGGERRRMPPVKPTAIDAGDVPAGIIGRGESRPARLPMGGTTTNGFGSGTRPPGGEVFAAVGIPGAKSIVYVVDRSGRMDGLADFIKSELAKATNKLRETQSVDVLWYGPKGSGKPTVLSPTLLPATEENKTKLMRHLADVKFNGETEPRAALLQALELRPELLYILTDASPDPALVEEVTKNNAGKSRIHFVWFAEAGDQPDAALKKLAADNKGNVKVIDSGKLIGK